MSTAEESNRRRLPLSPSAVSMWGESHGSALSSLSTSLSMRLSMEQSFAWCQAHNAVIALIVALRAIMTHEAH
jgi:hypothetical protein